MTRHRPQPRPLPLPLPRAAGDIEGGARWRAFVWRALAVYAVAWAAGIIWLAIWLWP